MKTFTIYLFGKEFVSFSFGRSESDGGLEYVNNDGLMTEIVQDEEDEMPFGFSPGSAQAIARIVNRHNRLQERR